MWCRHNKTVAQVMIRWCLEQNYITIPKSEKEHRIIENAQVFDFHLSEQDYGEIVSTYCMWLRYTVTLCHHYFKYSFIKSVLLYEVGDDWETNEWTDSNQ